MTTTTPPISDTANAVAHAGTALVICLLVSQLPAVFQVIRRKKDIVELSPLPSLFQAGNFLAWTVYGFVKGDINIWLVNVIGCVFAAFYLAVFLIYLQDEHRTRFLKYMAGLITSFVVFFIPVLVVKPSSFAVNGLGDDSRQVALSIFAIAFNVLMYAAPLAAIKTALKHNDPARIPILLTLAGTGCSILWGTYGYMVPNYAILGPNAAGLVLNLIQVGAAGYLLVKTRGNASTRKTSDDESTALAGRDANLVGGVYEAL